MDTPRHLRAVALCLLRHPNFPDRILISREWDAVKQSYYCRPLGGGIEFGERSEDAVRREIREELGQEIHEVQLLGVVENLFELEGRACHEIVFLFDARFCDLSLYERPELPAFEHAVNASFSAFWASREEIEARGDRLVPEALCAMLDGSSST